MNEYILISLRAIFLFVFLLFILRLMGKREIGELGILDMVVIIMIGDLAVVAIGDTQKPIIHSLLPIVAIALIQIILSMLSLRSQTFRVVVEGKPTIIISKGKIDEKAMKKQRYNFDDLLTQLREQNIINIADVEFAILEQSGQLSVIEKKDVRSNETISPFPLVIDGVPQEDSLSLINKDLSWLRQELKKKGYEDMNKISLCTFDGGVFYIDENNQPHSEKK